MIWRCEMCGTNVPAGADCPACELYNDAVRAQKRAAQSFAKRFSRYARRAWLNEHGIFAFIHGKAVQIGRREEAAPFVALTTAARRVTKFWSIDGSDAGASPCAD